MNTLRLDLTSIENLPAIAGEILNFAGNEKIICFYGPMGAGKTTLIKAICRLAGVEESTSSPTFSLVNEYHTIKGKAVYHFDFYRIRNEQEALDIGIYDYLDSGSHCLIEWPEKIYNLLPEHFVKVEIDLTPDSARKITLSR